MLLSKNARTVLERRYLKKDEAGVCEQPEDMLRRVAETIASADTAYGGDAANTGASWASFRPVSCCP